MSVNASSKLEILSRDHGAAPAAGARRSLRVLLCMRAPVGGLFRHVLDLAGELSARGHAVGIVVDSSTADSLTAARLAAIAPALALGLHRVAMDRLPGVGDFAASRAVLEVAKKLDVDVLHGHGAKGGAYARLAGALLRDKDKRPAVFYTPHGGSLHYKRGSIESHIFLSIEKIFGLMSSGLIFESDYARRAYESLVGAGSVPVRVIPNGVKSEDFEPCLPAPDAADFVFVGELRDIKGVDVLLKALAILNQARAVTAVLVGAGPEAAALKSLASELGLDGRVSFPGAMPARNAFRLGRCLVVPSRAESFPYVVLEAGAAGLPVIATNVGGIPEMVVGTACELIEPANVRQLSEAMSEALDAPERAHTRAGELREMVARKFTVGTMTDAVIDFYFAALAV